MRALASLNFFSQWVFRAMPRSYAPIASFELRLSAFERADDRLKLLESVLERKTGYVLGQLLSIPSCPGIDREP